VLTDLGTLGGDNGQALWLNDAGEVIGQADLPGSLVHHGFLWRNGVMTDLGTLGSTSFAEEINSHGQVVGRSRTGDPTNPIQHAFLWEDGGPMIDLNALIPANSSLLLLDAAYINDRGEIAGHGLTPNGENHAFLLVPDGDCNGDCEAEMAASQNTALSAPNSATMKQGNETFVNPLERFRSQMRQRYHISGQPAAPRN
jgi:probable HAF family extracellular repeat protein